MPYVSLENFIKFGLQTPKLLETDRVLIDSMGQRIEEKAKMLAKLSASRAHPTSLLRQKVSLYSKYRLKPSSIYYIPHSHVEIAHIVQEMPARPDHVGKGAEQRQGARLANAATPPMTEIPYQKHVEQREECDEGQQQRQIHDDSDSGQTFGGN